MANYTPDGARSLVSRYFSKTEVYDITPHQAEVLLASTKGNRNINQSTVTRIAADIIEGRWAYNGESVIVDEDYALRDAHHRMHGIISAGKSAKMLVVIGVPAVTDFGADVQDTMDEGSNRTGGQSFTMHKIPNSSLAATVTKNIMTSGDDGYSSSASKVSNALVNKAYAENDAEIQAIVNWTRKITRALGVPTSPVAVFLYQALKHWDEPTVTQFIEGITNASLGGVLADGCQKLITVGSSGTGVRVQTYELLRHTADAWRSGRKKVNTKRELSAWK